MPETRLLRNVQPGFSTSCERYLRKLDSALFLCNLELKSEEIPLRDENTDIEQQTEDRLMIEKMYSCLRLLDPDDAEFIRTLAP